MKSYSERKTMLLNQAKEFEKKLKGLEDKRATEIGKIAMKFGLDSMDDSQLENIFRAAKQASPAEA